MQNNILKITGVSLALISVAGCSDWLTPEPSKGYDQYDYYNNQVIYPGDYEKKWEDLRAWKETPGLPQTFVWFDSWSGASNTGNESMRALPDSVTLIGYWGLHAADTSKFDLSETRKEDKRITQEVKGTKVVVTFFARFWGEGLPKSRCPHWYVEGGNDYNYDQSMSFKQDEEELRPYIRRYAEDIYQACID
ncbi:endo-beta-N-acetylglucosaminidase, partial [gut metagenome]